MKPLSSNPVGQPVGMSVEICEGGLPDRMKHPETSGRGSLEIRLLGRLEVLRDDKPLVLPASKKSRALLAYLVATARAARRERLCELLWDAPDDPRASLRWSLAKVRPLVDEEGVTRLLGDRDEIVFDPKGATIDCVVLQRELTPSPVVASIETLRRAAARFRGDFLEGLDLTGCYRYHEWWITERERLRAMRVAVLGQLIERVRDTPDEALEYARQLLALDPLSEASHIRLIRLLGDMGKTREAIAQYDRCKRVLASELGIQPSAELQLTRMNLTGRAPGPVAKPSASEPLAAPLPDDAAMSPAGEAGLDAFPYVGRARELAVAQELVSQTMQGSEHGVLEVVGEPGIGKTRLMEELSRRVTSAGGVVLAGRAFEAETVRPYGAWIDALRSVALPELPSALKADLLPLLPELDSSPPIAGDRNRLFDAVTRLLTSLAPPVGALVVILDDVQWFDEASAALLHFTARELSRSRVLFACGARPAELADNPVALRLLRSLARERRLTEVVLSPMDKTETMALVRAAAKGVDPERVYKESEGNPFFALEIARALDAGEQSFSKTLEQLIGDRFDRLEVQTAALLGWTAALGRSFRSDLVGQVVPFPPTELLDSIEELERRGILRSARAADGTATYDFAHDLIRQAAYLRTSEPRRRLLHLEIARALSKIPDPSADLASDVAHHAALGGDDDLCVRACITAGQRCIRIFANAEAQALANRGRQRLDRLDRTVRIPLHMTLLRLSIESGIWRTCARELESELSRTILEAQSAGLPAEVASGWELLSEMHEEEGDYTGAHDSIQRALSVVADSLALSERTSPEADPETKVRTMARAGRCLVQIERELPKAKELLEEAVLLSAPMSLVVPDILMGLGLVKHWEGDYEAAEKLLEQGWSSATAQLNHWLAYESLSRLVMLLLESGRPEAAVARCSELESLAGKLGEGSELPFAVTLRALARLAMGEAEAPAEVEHALGRLRAIDTKGHLAYSLNFAAEVAFGAGDLASAARRAEEALRAADAVERRTEVARSRLILARLAQRIGDAAAARSQLEALRDDLQRPLGMIAATRKALAALATELGVTIPTEIPTNPPTPLQQASGS
jgi:DNA-binding SARP family transcriptional activator